MFYTSLSQKKNGPSVIDLTSNQNSSILVNILSFARNINLSNRPVGGVFFYHSVLSNINNRKLVVIVMDAYLVLSNKMK